MNTAFFNAAEKECALQNQNHCVVKHCWEAKAPNCLSMEISIQLVLSYIHSSFGYLRLTTSLHPQKIRLRPFQPTENEVSLLVFRFKPLRWFMFQKVYKANAKPT